MTEQLFWLISPEARARLIQYQYERYGTKLDMASRKAPWQQEPPRPEIPIHTDMDEAELWRFMAAPPSGPERVK